MTWGARIIDTAEAREVADLAGSVKDIETAFELCRRLVVVFEASPVDVALVGALSTSIVIRYARSFNRAVRAGLPKELVDQLSPEQQELHQGICALRDKHVAHSVNDFEENIVAVLVQETPDPPALGSVEVRHGRWLGFDQTLTEACCGLCKTLLVAGRQRLEEEKLAFQASLASLPLDTIYALPQPSVPERTWTNIERSRRKGRVRPTRPLERTATPPLSGTPVGRTRRGKEEFMSEHETKVVGYFAYFSPAQVVCSAVDACVVSGSIKAMAEYLAEIDPLGASKATVKKTRFGEIRRGLATRCGLRF